MNSDGGQTVSVPRLIIIGAGGHGHVMLDVLRQQGGAQVIGFLDEDPQLHGQAIGGIPVLGSSSDSSMIATSQATHFLVAIGSNRVRADQFERMRELGLEPWSAIHPSVTIADTARLGEGAQVVAGVIANPEARVGENTILNTACTVDHHCQIGNHVFIGPGAHLGGEVTVGDFAFLGIGAIVLPRVAIGEGATVGAGAAVIKGVPAGVTVVGVPARPRSDSGPGT